MDINIVKIAKTIDNIGMEPLRLPTEEKVRAAAREGEDAAVSTVFVTWRSRAGGETTDDPSGTIDETAK